MEFDSEAVARWVQPNPAQVAAWRAGWGQVMDLALWGDLKSSQLGAAGKLRKRILDLGERLRSYTRDREWIPHPRERIKNCLSSGLQLREAITKVEEGLALLESGEALAPMRGLWDNLAQSLLEDLAERERQLVDLLNRQYGETV